MTFVVNLTADLIVQGGFAMSDNPFAPPHAARNRTQDGSRKRSPNGSLAAITLLLIVPLVPIFGYLVVQAWPVLEPVLPAGRIPRTT